MLTSQNIIIIVLSVVLLSLGALLAVLLVKLRRNSSSIKKHEDEYHVLQMELEKNQNKLKFIQEDICEKEALLKIAQDEVAKIELQLQESLSDVKQDKGRIEELERQKASLKSKIEELQHGIDIKNIDIKRLQKEFSILHEKLTSAQNDVHYKEQELEKAKETTALLEIKLADALANTQQDKLQIEQLDKQISQLNDEIDELEADIEDKNIEISRFRKSVNDLEVLLHETEHKLKNLQVSFDELQKSYDKVIEQLSAKTKAISFVGEILSAQLASDEKDLDNAVDRLHDFICEDVNAILSKIATTYQIPYQLVDTGRVKNWAIAAKKTWLGEKTTIAFVGEFSAGKTSIVNRILSQDKDNTALLPVNMQPTTAIPTYITGGLENNYRFYTPDYKLKEISEESFMRVSKDMLANVNGISSLISFFVMKYKNENLSKISILDTPGFSSNDASDAQRTIDVINECDALFWVFDVNIGNLGQTAIERINEITTVLKKHLKRPLFIIINKADTKSPKEIEQVEQKIKETLSLHGIVSQKIIRFSHNKTLHALSHIMDAIKEVKHDETRNSVLKEVDSEIMAILSKLETIESEQQYSFNVMHQLSKKIMYNYNNQQRELNNLCEDAKEIPQYDTHWLRDDDYHLSIEEYNELVTKLNEISAHSNGMKELFTSHKDVISKCEKENDKLLEIQHDLSMLQDIQTRFCLLLNAYKKAMQKTPKDTQFNDNNTKNKKHKKNKH